MEKMNLDEDLLKLQGALRGLSVTTPDNEKLQVLSSLFQNIDETAKTKLVFFLILHTKMPLTDLLSSDGSVEAINKACQNLDFPALSYLIFNLNLVGSLGEIISNGPAALTVEVLSGVFAYADSREKIRGMEKVIIGIFEKILKISRGIHQDFYFAKKLWEFMSTFGEMVWCAASFEHEELLEEDMNNILETCLICVNLYNGSTPLSFNRNYELKVLYDKLEIDENLDEIQEPDCQTQFRIYVRKLLDMFYDIFNTSFKYDPVESLRALSENANALHEKLEYSEIEPHNLHYLNEVMTEPESELERIGGSDIYTTVYNLLTTRASKNWFKALVNFPNLAESEEAMNSMSNHLDSADSQDLMAIVSVIHEEFKKSAVSDTLIKLYLCCLSKMTLVDQLFHFENYFSLQQRPNLENYSFEEELTEMFNKLLESQARLTSTKSCLISFCIRSPLKTIKKICEQALYNIGQLCMCVDDLKMLKAACLAKNFSSEEEPKMSIITSVLCEMIDNGSYGPREKPLLITLITRLQKEKLLDEKIENFILNIIHRELSLTNYEKTELALEILRGSVRSKFFRANETILLAFCSEILNQTLWSCSTFTIKLVRIREMVTSIISSLMRNPKFLAKDTKVVWLRYRIMASEEINRLHFCDLWYSYDYELTTSNDLYAQLFILLHTRTRVDSIIDFLIKTFQSQTLLTLRISFTAAFIKILPILLPREWTLLLTHVKSVIIAWLHLQQEKSDADLVIFRIFTLSLYCLAQDMNQNKDMMSCFTYCLRNFGKMIQQNFLMGSDLKYEVAVVFVEEILFLLNGIQDPWLRRENSISLSPVILEIESLAKNNAPEEGGKLAELENWFKTSFIAEIPNEPLNDQ